MPTAQQEVNIGINSWKVTGRSVRGASHERKDLPNQDAIVWRPPDGEGLPLVLAVSDGHGSSKYIRSDVGAKLAAEVATDLVWEMLTSRPPAALAESTSIATDQINK